MTSTGAMSSTEIHPLGARQIQSIALTTRAAVEIHPASVESSTWRILCDHPEQWAKLADQPELAMPGRWVGSNAGGILGKVRFLYFSPREYIVLFGSPTGTQGFSGRDKRVQI